MIRQISYTLERSPKRRKTISILIKDQEVIVRAPAKTSTARINEIIETKAAWIEKKVSENRAQTKIRSRGYVNGETFKFLGRDYPLLLQEAPVKRVQAAAFAGGCLLVKAPIGLPAEASARWAKSSLERWYRPRAKSLMAKMAADWAGKIGVSPEMVRVKALKRSWGICTRNNITLNWRLIMAPPPIIEYVVVHELCHLRHKNHSASFYQLLASFLPDYKTRRLDLKELAPYLDLRGAGENTTDAD